MRSQNLFPESPDLSQVVMASCELKTGKRLGNQRDSRRLSRIVAGRKLAGVTGLEPVAFCNFAKENEWKFGHVHTGAHKI